MKKLMIICFAVFHITANAQIECILPLCLNKVDVKEYNIKGPVKSMRITMHKFDSKSGETSVRESVYEYNPKGNITKNNDFPDAYKITQYDKTGKKRLSCTLYSEKDNQIINRITYQYNKKGDLSKYSYCGPTDTIIINYEYRYLKNGKIDEYVAYSESDSSLWAKTDLVYANGKLCNIICYGATKPISFTVVDGAGHETEEISYNNYGNIRSHTAYKYSNDNIVEEIDYDGDSTDITTYKYNEYGDCISEKLPIGEEQITKYEGYDSFGNWTKKQWSYGDRQVTEVRKIEYYE